MSKLDELINLEVAQLDVEVSEPTIDPSRSDYDFLNSLIGGEICSLDSCLALMRRIVNNLHGFRYNLRLVLSQTNLSSWGLCVKTESGKVIKRFINYKDIDGLTQFIKELNNSK